jgi:HEAT repeat protein
VGLSSWLYGRQLEKQHARGVQAIVAELGDSNLKVREKAATTLWGLIDRLTDSERPVAEQALRTSACSDEDGFVKANAVCALLGLGSPGAVDKALELLGDRDWVARTLVASQLGRVDDPRVLDALLPLLQDEEGWVRQAAAGSLGQLGDVRALKPLRELVNRERKDVVVKQTAKEAVAMLEDEQTGN